MNQKNSITISMAEIVRAFAVYKQEHGVPPTPEVELRVPFDMPGMLSLENIIKEFTFPHYDSQAYNNAFIEMLSKGFLHNASFIYDMSIYYRYHRPISKYMEALPESTLQIGPGGSLGCEVLLCMFGVRRAYTLDPFPLLTFDLDSFMKTMKKLFEVMRWFEGVNGFEPFSLRAPEYETIDKGKYRVGESTIQHIYPRTFEDTGFESETIDFLFSQATLEHVRDPLKCIKETSRVLKPGGLTAHCIDLRDHRDFEEPLKFLRESDESWARAMEEHCRYDASGYMNRWRASEYVKAFEQQGFELLESVPEMKVSNEILNSEIPVMAKRFSGFSKEDLATITTFIVARKV